MDIKERTKKILDKLDAMSDEEFLELLEECDKMPEVFAIEQEEEQ